MARWLGMCAIVALALVAAAPASAATPTETLKSYGDVVLKDPLGPLDRVEHWLRKSPEEPELLAASAKLALRAELIGKARSYLEASLARKPTPENALLYAELLEQLDEGDRARAILRDSVARSVGRRPTLPRVRLRRQ